MINIPFNFIWFVFNILSDSLQHIIPRIKLLVTWTLMQHYEIRPEIDIEKDNQLDNTTEKLQVVNARKGPL